eukprot:15354761-Ditylum_brightwellii.AAC.1
MGKQLVRDKVRPPSRHKTWSGVLTGFDCPSDWKLGILNVESWRGWHNCGAIVAWLARLWDNS